MESPPSLETVHQAVFTLYHNPDPAAKEKASFWLGELQKSVYSWKVADDILLTMNDVELCYFAAQTMRSKIQLSFHELPPDSHVPLRDSLISHISKTNESTNGVIVTQLCLALADLALQMCSWESPVVDLIDRFSLSSTQALIEILTFLPEEVNSRALRLGANRRQHILHSLASSLPSLSGFLKMCLENSNNSPQIQCRVLKCFTSWVSVQAVALNDVADSIFVATAFNILANRESTGSLHEAAADCISRLLESLEDNNNQQEIEMKLFSGVTSLEQAFHFSVAHEENEKAMNYCRVFTELAESFLEKIVAGSSPNKPHFAIKIFDLVLMCVGHHDYEVAAITFNLWYRLSEELYQKKDSGLTSLFKPYIERLIEGLCRHCQIEPDHEGLLEEGDDFPDFRVKVAELIRDVVFIIGSSNCFRQMFLSLQAPSTTWDSSEAALFIMQAVAKNILPEENDVVPKVVEALLNLPADTHIAVRYTSLLLLGELCEWMEKHPQSLEPVLNLVLFCLHQPLLANAAATCLQSIMTCCRHHMATRFNDILQILKSLDQFNISNESAVGLLKGVAVILSVMPQDQVQNSVREVCHLQISPLCQLLVEEDVKVVRGTKTDPAVWMDRLAAIFRHLSVSVQNGQIHPCQPLITQIWAVLSSVFTKYQDNSHIMERSCRCLRFILRSVGKQSAPLLEPLVKQMITLYTGNKHSCFLYLGSILVDEYATESGCIGGLLEMVQAFIPPAFGLLQGEAGLKSHPDTVDDLFRLCGRFLQRAAIPFLTSPVLNSVLECALSAVALDHRDANASVMKFFFELVNSGRRHETSEDYPLRRRLVSKLLEERGQELTHNLIHASVFYLHTYMLADVSDVLMELLIFDRPSVCQWMEEALKRMPTQTSGGAITATPQQLLEFHSRFSSFENSKALHSVLKEFARLYR